MDQAKEQYKLLKNLLSEFRTLDKKVYWIDLTLTVILSWPLFFYAAFTQGTLSLLSFIISVFAIYRGTIFIHEVAHFEKEIKGFKFIFNLFFGWPNCFPAYLYTPHFFHHGKKTYGTLKDPEYLYLEKNKTSTLIGPVIIATILPLFHIVRFGIIPLLYPILSKKFILRIFQKYSTLVMNPNYIRKQRYDNEISEMKINDFMCACYKWIPLILIYLDLLPIKVLYLYFIALYCAMVLNMYRAKFNHRYKNPNVPMTDMAQLLENITVEGSILSELWSPTALRFHTIHHVVQDIPYHNLKKAHEKLKRELPKSHPYFETIEKSFFSAWTSHYKMLKKN
jgi:fatty acid desaturase